MTLASIIARIEAGETGRELEAEIALAIGAEREGNTFWFKGECFVLERDYYDIEGSPRELPAYLTDLNAAVSLVPEGWFWGVANSIEGPKPDLSGSTAMTCKVGDTVAKAFTGTAPTPAAASTCAALKARIEQ